MKVQGDEMPTQDEVKDEMVHLVAVEQDVNFLNQDVEENY